MALDEFIFGKLNSYFRKKKVSAEVVQRTVELEEIKPRLIILASALSGCAVDIYPAIEEGGYKGNSFFLPQTFSFYTDKQLNLEFYLFRTFYLTVQKQLNLNCYDKPVLDDNEARKLAETNADIVLEKLFTEYPLLQPVFTRLSSAVNPEQGTAISSRWLYGKWMTDTMYEEKEAIVTDAVLHRNKNVIPETIIKSKPVEEILNLIIDTKQQEDYVLTHNFEKVDTADEFNGSWRDFDGDDELENHKDALDELNMKYTVRVDDTAHSVYEASFAANSTVAESKEAEATGHYLVYDEWNCYKKKYNKDYSRVFPLQQAITDADYYNNTLHNNRNVLVRLRKMLTSINNKWQMQKLQPLGKEIDIDMAVNRFADIYSGHTPSDNIYISDRKNEKELSVLLLLDISLSSDSYAAGNRVIDVEKQTAILFGEILNEYNIDFSIHCFYSKTRNYCSYLTIKDFDESWQTGKYKTGAVQPEGYTRIGPALRHSASLLSLRESKNKWIILLSDGKPNDYDHYEGRYGINDVKQALRELNAQNINTFALAIEASAKYYLPQMFGQNHYQIVSSPVELLTSLTKLYERIRYNC